MGIRFHCHHCRYELHVKDFQASKRGRCPECQGKFRIPPHDAELSLEVDSPAPLLVTTASTPNPTTRVVKSSGTAQEPKKPAARSESQPIAQDRSPVDKSGTRTASENSKLPANTTVEKSVVGKSAAAVAGTQTPTTQPASIPTEPHPPTAQPQLPAAIATYPQATWHVRPASGGEYGPAPAETMGQWLIQGRVARDALVWRDDWPEWQIASEALSDYFGSEQTEPVASEAGSQLKTQPPSSDANSSAASTPLPVTASGLSRLERKHKKRQRYILIISVLTVMFVALVAVLLVVLLSPAK